jgi:hypothetical protein
MTAMTMFRVCRVYLAALLVAVGTLIVGSGTAQALTVEQTCVGTEVTSYNPPLTFTTRPVTVTVNGIFTSCTNPDAPTGFYSETFTISASCLVPLEVASPTRTIVWGNAEAEPSAFRYNVTETEVGGQLIVTSTGAITHGTFAPASAEQIVTLMTLNTLQCLSTGISNVTGPTSLTIYRT